MRGLEKQGCPIMQMNSLGKGESLMIWESPIAGSPFQCKVRQLQGRQRAFLPSAGFLLLLTQSNVHAKWPILGLPALGPHSSEV